jgi:hypothetical protein
MALDKVIKMIRAVDHINIMIETRVVTMGEAILQHA